MASVGSARLLAANPFASAVEAPRISPLNFTNKIVIFTYGVISSYFIAPIVYILLDEGSERSPGASSRLPGREFAGFPIRFRQLRRRVCCAAFGSAFARDTP